jgi:16S rRNA (adenine1518-N6/adenine1519-N6)-dimethyltransferase
MDPTLDIPSINPVALLRKHQLNPKKGLGQNFLVDAGTLKRIVCAAEVNTTSAVLEIGPGLGSLTRYLAQASRRVVAVELDQQMVPILREVVSEWNNVEIVQGDILEQNPGQLMAEDDYLVVANIPYYITSAVIRHLLQSQIKPARLVLTMQLEVAQRICALPGDLSLLALSIQVYGKPRNVLRIPAGAFYPAPKVDSATLRVDLFPQPLIPTNQIETFFQLAKAGFSQKRKTLRNSMSGGLGLPRENVEQLLTSARVDPQRRAETLSLEEWKLLTEIYCSQKS